MSKEACNLQTTPVHHGQLPIGCPTAAGQDVSAVPVSLPARPRVMMVDDEKLNSLVVGEYLKADGYRDVAYTTDPREALSLAHAYAPT